MKAPLVALIGLPNSGKSTLINRICNFKKAVVADEAHTTRDLNWGEDVWENMYIRFVDTGGLVPGAEDKIQKEVQIRTFSAIAEADLLLWVIDRKQNPETISDLIIQKVWKTGKPFIIGINKVDDPNAEKDISEYAKLGGVDFVNFSAISSYNLNELMDKIVEQLQKIGFEANYVDEEMEKVKQPKGKKYLQKNQIVKKNKDGTYFVVRENSSDGPGLFKALSKNEVYGFEQAKAG